MNKKNLLCFVKKLTAVVLTTGMIVAGILVVPKQADATVVEDKVIYEEGYDIKLYWDAENPKAPVKAGYVFGGWYSAKEENAYLTKEQAAQTTTAYAKFVPAQVLSVKAQNKAGTGDTVTDNTHVRIISSLDSKNYTKVGFDIYLANSVKLVKDNDYTKNEPLETDKIYDGILVGENKTPKDAVDIFGGVSKYVSVWQLNNIDSAHWSKIIYVRPYWITMDGTKVEGLAKYVHIEDDYEGYISVPINVLNKDVAAQVAAGAVNVTYKNGSGKTVALAFKEVEAGRMLPTMASVVTPGPVQIEGFDNLTLKDFEDANGEVMAAGEYEGIKNGEDGFYYAKNLTSLHKKILSMKVKFEAGDYTHSLVLGGTKLWQGFNIYPSSDGTQLVVGETWAGSLIDKNTYTPHTLNASTAGVTSFLNEEFTLELSFEYGEAVSGKADLKLGIYINGNLYNNEVFTIAGCNTSATGTVFYVYREGVGKSIFLDNLEKDGNTIKLVGHSNNVNQYNSDETLYANIRFQKPDNATTDVDVDFDMTMVQFCNWNEEDVTVAEKWDVKYDAQ